MRFSIPDTIPRAALIVGGGRQVGLAIAHTLAGEGFAIAMQADEDIGDMLPAGSLVLPSVQSAPVARAIAALGPVGVLVNIASSPESESCDAHELIRQFAGMLPEPHEGVAINLLGQGVWSLMPHAIEYSLSKAALWRLTQTMALACAPRVRINGIGSGPILGGRSQPHEPDPHQIPRAVLAILAFRSMTGQMIVPDGVPPPGVRD